MARIDSGPGLKPHDQSSADRCAARPRPGYAPSGNGDAGGDGRGVCILGAFRRARPGVGLAARFQRGGDGGRPGGLVCGERAVSPPAGPADTAHRPHSRQQGPHRGHHGRFSAREFSDALGGGAAIARSGYGRCARAVSQRPGARWRLAAARGGGAGAGRSAARARRREARRVDSLRLAGAAGEDRTGPAGRAIAGRGAGRGASPAAAGGGAAPRGPRAGSERGAAARENIGTRRGLDALDGA